MRPRPLAEFNDAIVFSNRPLRDGEIFEITLDSIVDRWSGSIELGKKNSWCAITENYVNFRHIYSRCYSSTSR